MTISLTKTQKREACVKLYGLLIDGASDREAMDAMGLDVETFTDVKASMFDMKAEEVRTKPTEHVYVQYLLDQGRNLRELSDLVGMFRHTKQYSALVGAVRVRAEILDHVIDKGQQFGLIEKKPDERVIRAGVVVSQLSQPELKRLIMSELTGLNRMMSDERDVNILDIDPGPLHRPAPALPPATPATTPIPAPAVQPDRAVSTKHFRAGTAKVSGGRRRVMTKAVATAGPGTEPRGPSDLLGVVDDGEG